MPLRRPLWSLAVAMALCVALFRWLGSGEGRHAPPPAVGRYCLRAVKWEYGKSPAPGLHLWQVYLEGEEVLGDNIDPQSILCKSAHIFTKKRTWIWKIPVDASRAWPWEAGGEKNPPAFPFPRIGQRLVLEARFLPPRQATNPGEWDMAAYYASIGVVGELAEVEILAASTSYDVWGQCLARWRFLARQRLMERLPPRVAGVASALALGIKADVEEEVKNHFVRMGIIHILSISGLHIGILGLGVRSLLRRLGLGEGSASFLAGLMLLAYGQMTGMGISQARAIGMFAIHSLGRALGRSYDMPTALGCMAMVLLSGNGGNLENAGFLFSFGCLFGLSWLEWGEACWWWDRGEFARQDWRGRAAMVWRWFWLRQVFPAFWSSLSVTLVTLPVYLVFSYGISPYSVLANMLVIPLAPALVYGTLAVLALPAPLWAWAGALVSGILDGMEALCAFFAGCPVFLWRPGVPAPAQIVAYFFLLWLWRRIFLQRCQEHREKDLAAIRQRKRGKGLLRAAGALALLAAAMAVIGFSPYWRWGGHMLAGILDEGRAVLRGQGFSIWQEPSRQERFQQEPPRQEPSRQERFQQEPPRQEPSRQELFQQEPLRQGLFRQESSWFIPPMEIAFLDVGQGDGIVWEIAPGRAYIIDCGSTTKSGPGKRILLPYLHYKGIHTIEGIWISHGDRDHVNGLWELLEEAWDQGIEVRKIYLPGDGRRHLLYQEMLNHGGTGVEAVFMAQGDGIQGGSWSLECLTPVWDKNYESENAASLCLLLEAGGLRLLFAGDAEGEGEEDLQRALTARGVDYVDVLKVAHHGSKYSTGEAFLSGLDLGVAMLSHASPSPYGHPHRELLYRLEAEGARLYSTGWHGAVILRLSGEGFSVRSWR